MNDKDYIKDLFSDKLGSYEAKVNPELWKGVASQIGANAGSVATSTLTLTSKVIIGVSITAAAILTTVLVLSSDKKEVQEQAVALVEEHVENTVEEVVVDNEKSSTNNSTEEKSHNSLPEPERQQDAPIEEDTPLFIPKSNESNKKEGAPLSPNENLTIVDPLAGEVEFIEEPEVEYNTSSNVDYTLGSLPNIITPNGDNVNDVLVVQSSGLTKFHIVIMDDKGSVVFESTDSNFLWDGTNQVGEQVPEGNYVYIIKANEFENDKPKRYSPLRVVR